MTPLFLSEIFPFHETQSCSDAAAVFAARGKEQCRRCADLFWLEYGRRYAAKLPLQRKTPPPLPS